DKHDYQDVAMLTRTWRGGRAVECGGLEITCDRLDASPQAWITPRSHDYRDLQGPTDAYSVTKSLPNQELGDGIPNAAH
ncbi:MAG: hypothetical protein WCC84_13700, partial [Candidatus Cybelea sp.]